MEPLSMIAGIGIIVFLLLYIAFKLESEEEVTLKIIKLFIILFAVFFLILIPKVIVDSGTECKLLLNWTNQSAAYVYGNNFTDGSFHWSTDSGPAAGSITNDAYDFHDYTTVNYYYSEYCINTPYNTNGVIYKQYVSFVTIFMTLLLIYFIYVALRHIKIKWSK